MIRSVAPIDLWALRRKPRSQAVLYNADLLVQPHRPLWFALLCMLEGAGRDRAMTAFRECGLSAFVQAQGRAGRPEQDIIYLSTHGQMGRGAPSDRDIWFRLLEQLCVSAGHNHVQRLYASISNQQVELREIFRQLGFQAYAHRTILQLSGPDWDQGTTIAPMRTQVRQDRWAIHKLYGIVTPRFVQQAEARNPRDWMLPLTQHWKRLYRRGWVLGPDDNLVAYVHATSGPSGHVLTLLMHPGARDLVNDVLRFGLAQLPDTRPVYLLLHEYQEELVTPAQDLGFQPMGEQTMLVKSTVVPVRRSVLLPVLEPGLDPQVTIPSISTPREDPQIYVIRATRSNKQYRSAP